VFDCKSVMPHNVDNHSNEDWNADCFFFTRTCVFSLLECVLSLVIYARVCSLSWNVFSLLKCVLFLRMCFVQDWNADRSLFVLLCVMS